MKIIFLFFAFLFLSLNVNADVNFSDFYRPDSLFNIWVSVAIASVVAAILGLVVLYTGGTASPIVATIGTWVGGLLGLKGVAATNAGLALLGGGSIASGGFGMVGGAAVLTVALTFSGELVFDYAYSSGKQAYDYSEFRKQSQNMTNFPLPQNTSGSEVYNQSVRLLLNVELAENEYIFDKPEFLHVVNVLESKRDNIGLDSKEASLLGLLYFISNNYLKAYDLANSYLVGEESEVLSVIKAISAIYLENFNPQEVVNNFIYTTRSIDKNFNILSNVIFMDRLYYRVIENDIPFEQIESIYEEVYLSQHIKEKGVLQQSLNVRGLMYVKLKQQAILSIYNQKNEDIWLDENLIDYLSYELDEYLYVVNYLLHRNMILIDDIQSIIDSRRIRGASSWEKEWLDFLEDSVNLLVQYEIGYEDLRIMIEEIYDFQIEKNKHVSFLKRLFG